MTAKKEEPTSPIRGLLNQQGHALFDFNPKSEFSLRQIKLVLFQAVMRE